MPRAIIRSMLLCSCLQPVLLSEDKPSIFNEMDNQKQNVTKRFPRNGGIQGDVDEFVRNFQAVAFHDSPGPGNQR